MRDHDVTPLSRFTAASLVERFGKGANHRLARELGVSKGQLSNHIAGRRYRDDIEAWLCGRCGIPYALTPRPASTVRSLLKTGNPGTRTRRAGAPKRAGDRVVDRGMTPTQRRQA